MPSDLAHLSTLIGSNYPCLELIFMVPKVFEPLKFDCIYLLDNTYIFSVAQGIAFFKEGRQTEAMQQLNKALQIDTTNVEALVARGAL